MTSLVLAGTAATLIGLAACRPAAGPDSANGANHITVEWKGVVNRSFAAPAQARWCARDGLLEILASRADTGVGLALVMQDSLRAGQHPVVSSALPVDWRPLALAAIRWVNDTGVRGFEGNLGSITVTEAGPGGVSGTVDVRLKHLTTSDTLRMTGQFTSVPVVPSDSICGRARQSAAGR